MQVGHDIITPANCKSKLEFQPTNNAELLNKQWTFIYKFSSGYGLTNFKNRHIAKPCPLAEL
jgi:hypothetical protein